MDKQNVSGYYDYMVRFYRFWFVRSGASALHYGFSEPGMSFNDSLINTNRFLARKAKIKSTDYVLDAGCGIGGSAIWLAENIGCRIDGITLSEQQVGKAKSLAQKRKVSDKTTFANMDFSSTKFKDNTFDVVWALESLCHSNNKTKTLKELRRVLKPEGRIIIGDGFLLRKPENDKEAARLKQFEEGFVIPPLVTPQSLSDFLRNAGFSDTKKWDTSNKVRQSSRRMYYLCIPSYCVAKVLEKLRLTSPYLTKNNLAGIAQYYCVKKGVCGYNVFLSTK